MRDLAVSRAEQCRRLQLRAQELFELALDAHEQGRAEDYQRLECEALQLRARVSALKKPHERTRLDRGDSAGLVTDHPATSYAASDAAPEVPQAGAARSASVP